MLLVYRFLYLAALASAYTPLSDSFLKAIPSGGSDFDIDNGTLLAPILTPRVSGSPGHARAQQHFVDFFRTTLPKWTIEWHNSTPPATTSTAGSTIPTPPAFANLMFTREPPWTKPGQANFLTLVTHYDSKAAPAGFVGATDAVPCAVLMHVARSIDGYLTQMHDEMAALGEGGTVEQDMAVRIVLVDGSGEAGAFSEKGAGRGARYASLHLETPSLIPQRLL